VEFWAECGSNYISSSGNVLIDPDGYIFDVTEGFDPETPTLNAVAGVTVTLYISATEWGGWTPWPAQMYNNQVNPQVTTSDGYFAFFTPPGFYYLEMDGVSGYQPWRSPVIQVINEIVHVNVPYTPLPAVSNAVEAVSEILLTPDGPQPPSINVELGDTVQWQVEVGGLAAPALLIQQVENPLFQPLSALNPLSNTIGWDGGLLQPGQIYQRQMNHAGLYIYSDGLGHEGQICVENCSPTAISLLEMSLAHPSSHFPFIWLVGIIVLAASTMLTLTFPGRRPRRFHGDLPLSKIAENNRKRFWKV
jgi:hypothetical protein